MKIETMLSKLGYQEKIELFHQLEMELSTLESERLIREKSDEVLECPYCHSSNIRGHGKYKGRKRFKCLSCARTFNILSETSGAGLKKLELFRQYTRMALESIPVRTAARTLGVNVKTITNWRTRILTAFDGENGQKL